MKNDNGRASILIIDDDTRVREALPRPLEDDYIVETASTGEEGLSLARKKDFNVVVTDFQMLPGMSGLEVIKLLHPVKPHLPIILMTGHHETDTAIEAIKLGAFDYVLKPIKAEEFLELIGKAVTSGALTVTPVAMGEDISGCDAIIGKSRVMQNVYAEIGRVAAKPVTVLIRGETGTGKELVARAVFQHSDDRSRQPFIIVNCAAIPEPLLESELFGHEPGAFTGAQTRRIGKFEQADKGTIFLDEIGDMNLSLQAKFLRVLQEKNIQRVGGKETINVDVRVIAATHRDLEQGVEEKQFRADLYYRLNDAVIRLPSLRERRDDIPDLVRYFLHEQGAELAATKPDATEILRRLAYPWPGNVRELRSVLHNAVVLAHGHPIDPEIIRTALGDISLSEPQTLQAYVARLLDSADREAETDVAAAVTDWVERELYGQAIRLAEGDQTQVAKWLGVSRPTVRDRLLRYGFHPQPDGDIRKEAG
jgi:DNA-binding NtrC family response regulator